MVGFKNRFMLMEIYLNPDNDILGETSPIILTKLNIKTAIEESIRINFGECGLGSALGSFDVKHVNEITKLCIVRSSRDDHRQVWSAMTLVKSIGNYPVIFNLLDVTGCVRTCKETALKCENDKFEQCCNKLSEVEKLKHSNYLERIKNFKT
ncbi:hypothetical protein AALP_AA1G040900 [Arabis alpina]|uniref:Ribonuclease P/MRP protein subunit POP5 n=1 Tax=Arabis alpina TaxID=50452 RepID=A0A087HL03_ARAAL|nr:hypothetical protein AALP_AA1G040900 [Arabis alpina]